MSTDFRRSTSIGSDCLAGGIIDAYRAFLPVSDATPVVSLHEGNTPLLFAPAPF